MAVTVSGCLMHQKITPVDYAWTLESVLNVDRNGAVKGPPKTPTFNAKQLFTWEQCAGTMNQPETLRLIQNQAGFYFITAPGFKNVYVFRPGDASLELINTIGIDPNGMSRPAFNQRVPFIQLIHGSKVFMLDEKGIKK